MLDNWVNVKALINNKMKILKNRCAVRPFVCLFLLFCTGAITLNAQDSLSTKKWHYLADVYIMFPYLKGETGVGSALTVPVDASAGDVFSNLKMAAMLYLEARTDKWAISSDLVYMNLNQEITPNNLVHSGDVGLKQTIWEVAGLYRILPFWEAGVGGRFNFLQTNIEARKNVFPAGTEEVTGLHDAVWFDPIIVTRLTTDINDEWLFQFRGDLGGFGVGSDFTYQLQAYAGYRFNKVFQLTAGYRFLSTDYKKQLDYSQFVFDMNESGPVIRFGFNF